MFDGDLSIRQNIEATLLEEFAPLFREPEFLLRTELRELENYYAILVAIASGETTLAELERATGIARGSAHYYTQTLTDLGYLAKRYPLVALGQKAQSRHVRFAIADPLLRFWFRFVFPNQSSVVHLGPRKAYDVHIKGDVASYFGTCFERFCRQRLSALYRREAVAARYEIGEYWSSKAQIDLIGVRDDGRTDLGECKWGRVRSAAALRGELAAKIAAFPNPSGHTIARRFFVRQAPPRLRPEDGERWHTLDDLYRNN
jgi:AAA+ ATPase superfamily predicted ATPase